MNMRLLSRLLLLSIIPLLAYTPAQAKYPRRAASKAAKLNNSRKQQRKEKLAGGIQDLKDERVFPRLINGNDELWVMFYSSACGTCERMQRIINNYSKEHPHLPIIRVNRTRARRLSRQYKIEGTPTILVFKKGKHVKTIAGFKTLKKLTQAAQSS